MKFLAFLAFLLPFTVCGQTTTDYNHAMKRFQTFYNAGQGDSINAMFRHRPDDMKSSTLWTNDWNAASLKEYGKMKSFKFIGIDNSDPNKVYVFKTIFSKAGAKTTSLTLYDDLTVGTFRFMTTSESINELLRKSQSSR